MYYVNDFVYNIKKRLDFTKKQAIIYIIITKKTKKMFFCEKCVL